MKDQGSFPFYLEAEPDNPDRVLKPLLGDEAPQALGGDDPGDEAQVCSKRLGTHGKTDERKPCVLV